MSLELFRHLADVFTASDALLDEREPLIAAAQGAATADELPIPAQVMLRRLELRAARLAR